MIRDGNWVSGRGPQDLRAFDEAMVQLFSEWRSPGRPAPVPRRPLRRRLFAAAAIGASVLAVRSLVATRP